MEGVFFAWRRGGAGGGEGWRVECRRGQASTSVYMGEVVVLAEGGVLMRDKARAAGILEEDDGEQWKQEEPLSPRSASSTERSAAPWATYASAWTHVVMAAGGRTP
jgi:hypothetical protein